MSDEGGNAASTEPSSASPRRVAGWICVAVLLASIAMCVVLAGMRGKGLVRVTVTATDAEAEPRDHDLPLIRKKEALPDYQVLVILHDGDRINLGTKPDASAVNGLTWTLSDPVSVNDVASVRLQDQDKVISDVIAEVQIDDPSNADDVYRFEFDTEWAMSVGIQSFFRTPIGQAIAAAFCIAVIVLLASIFYP